MLVPTPRNALCSETGVKRAVATPTTTARNASPAYEPHRVRYDVPAGDVAQ